MRYEPLEIRLWRRIDKSGGPDACWPFTGSKAKSGGYGQIIIGGKGRGPRRVVHTHRLAFLLSGGVLTEEKPDVLHECDNPPCCNPKHLFAGNDQTNMADRTAKGRQWQQAKTACKSGHPFTLANTYIRKSGRRACRTCDRLSKQKRRAAARVG